MAIPDTVRRCTICGKPIRNRTRCTACAVGVWRMSHRTKEQISELRKRAETAIRRLDAAMHECEE